MAKDDTHYTLADTPVTRFGWTTAVCGARVNEYYGMDVDLQHPTCAACQQWLNDRNAPRIGEHGDYVQ